MIIGQDRLVEQLRQYTPATFPKTTMIIGDSGGGKKTIVQKVIAPTVQAEVIDITKDISYDFLIQVQLRASPAVYLIQLSELTEREQNIILKFIEEPPSRAHVVLVTESTVGVLDTIINRCVTFQLDTYKQAILETFFPNAGINPPNEEIPLHQSVNALIGRVCTTPGQVLSLDYTKLQEMYKLSETIVDKMHKAHIPNALTIANRIKFKKDSDGFDVNVFMKMLLSVSHERYVDTGKEGALTIYNIVNKYIGYFQNIRLHKEMLFDSMVLEIWEAIQ